MTDTVRHKEGTFYIERDGQLAAELTYRMSGNDMLVNHTYVNPALRGGTLGGDLVDAAVQWARKEKHKVVPLCSYVSSVFARRADYGDVKK